MARPVVRTWVNRRTGKHTKRITAQVVHHLSLDDMANALCSAYARNTPAEELGSLPERLPITRIMEAVREQYETYGTNAVWTWSDDARDVDQETCRGWAKRVIVAALPEMAETE
ncbi:hypothetical protein C9F11_10245 [Streptomyces sp. YIM 121038]|nr:hypothetical protein C9F11_10245 [Streptomyces sp. YIM 121038]